ncbi:MAG TPA: hypothetical protein VKV02_07265 [Acidobacteriaceae bacterium]|nr:hypothetical protein [Acidobacteriaceae bacterium]
MASQVLSRELFVFFIATVFVACVAFLLWKVRQSAWKEGDTNGVKRGIDIGKHYILREVQREQKLRQLQPQNYLPAGYSMIPTQELRRLQAFAAQRLLPSNADDMSNYTLAN